MGAWRMDGGLLKIRMAVIAMMGILVGCADDCPEGSRAYGDCVGTSRYTQGVVTASIGAPVAFDSVQVKLFRGSVESGNLVESESYGGGSRHLDWAVEFGSYSVLATYWRGAVSVEAVDGGTTSVTSKAECTCYTYDLETARLDVALAKWPK